MVVLMKTFLCAQARGCFELPLVGATTHAGDLANECVLAIEQGNVGFGEIVHCLFFDEEIAIAAGGDAWRVGDADDLLVLAEGFELVGDGGEHESADTGVYFIENEGLNATGATENGFDGKHDAAHLAAAGNVVQWTQRHARVRRDHEETGIGA